MGTKELLADRATTHGSFDDNAFYAQMLRGIFRTSPGWPLATRVQREGLDATALKLCRILSGQPDFKDHWADIAGYATLVADRCSK